VNVNPPRALPWGFRRHFFDMTDPKDLARLIALDKRYLWHPFTPMSAWSSEGHEPIVIAKGEGAVLEDARGRRYLDGNSSIWTNTHGHAHPRIDAALRAQLERIAHCSALGLTNDRAPLLAQRLIELLQPGGTHQAFFSDDGATAVETAIKMAWQARRLRGETKRVRFLSLRGSYHGDTVGAMSVGHVPVFHSAFSGLLYETRQIPMPDGYRDTHRDTPPVRGVSSTQTQGDGAAYLEELERILDEEAETAVALVMEPRIAGVAGFVFHPHGYLRRAAELCRERGIWLILDEVMTGFGRTGAMFACQREGVVPDLIALAKGLTGGYLPLAATLASREIQQAFAGHTFYHGHSYTANPLGCAAALANLEVFEEEETLSRIANLSVSLGRCAEELWEHPNVGDIRVEGAIAAIELVRDFATRARFDPAERVGARVCEAARRHGLLTRPIGDVILLMPPYCTTEHQIATMVDAVRQALLEVLPVG
jgi:adenosylmethionine-8-amino-7-oxononanoate aminotransferase